jgi:MATE family multidrug resistance protein
MAVAALVFLIFRHRLPLPWSPEPEVLVLAVGILPVAAAFQVFDGLQVVGAGVLRGIGDTRPAAWFNLVGFYTLGLPLAGLLAFGLDWGLTGLWWGLTLGLLTVSMLLVWRIRRRV